MAKISERERLAGQIAFARERLGSHARDRPTVTRTRRDGRPLGGEAVLGMLIKSAYWRAVFAFDQLLNASSGGEGIASHWQAVERSVFFQALNAASGIHIRDDLTPALFHAIVLGERAVASQLAARLGQSVRSEEHAAGFALALHDRWIGAESPARPLGKYAAALDRSIEGAALAKLMGVLCTEHLRRAGLRDLTGEFCGSYLLCPIEIAALGVVRDAEGLTTPSVDHPLLATALAEIPSGPTRYQPDCDPELAEAAELARAIDPRADAQIADCLRSQPCSPAARSVGPSIALDETEPAPSAFARALAVLPFTEPQSPIDPDLDAMAFSDLALDSAVGLHLDWKLTHEAVVEELGAASSFAIDRGWSRDRLVREVLEHLDDGRTPVRCRVFDGSDMDGYLLLTEELHTLLRSLLGAEFDSVFAPLESD